MHRHLLAPLTLVLALACSTKGTDDEDTSNASADTSTTASESETTSELSCDDANAAFEAFVVANNSCTIDGDCVNVGALCYLANVCGGVGLNASHDADALMEVYDQVVAACSQDQCGADPCGAMVSCVDSVCELSL